MSSLRGGLVDLDELGDARELLLAEEPRFVRGTLYMGIVAVFAFAGWSCFARVDVAVETAGVVRPSGDVIDVQSPLAGVVAEICSGTREGALVASGTLLLRLDRRPFELERATVIARRESRRVSLDDTRDMLRRLEHSFDAERHTRETDLSQAELELEAEASRARMAAALAKGRLETAFARSDAARTAAFEQQKKVARAERLAKEGFLRDLDVDDERITLANLKAALVLAGKQVEEARLAAVPDEGPVEAARGRVALRKKAIEELDALRDVKIAEAAARIPQLVGEIDDLGRELEGLALRIQKTEIRAPAAGLVTRLTVAHEGRVVNEGSPLVQLSPSRSALVLEALLRESDRGRALLGRPARLRFGAFRYQEFGTVPGRVVSISPDAAGGAYKITIEFPNDVVMDDRRGNRGHIELGMSAEASVVVEERPLLLSFLAELRGRR
jgi:HlyD family type I secretion membrane fusion protein